MTLKKGTSITQEMVLAAIVDAAFKNAPVHHYVKYGQTHTLSFNVGDTFVRRVSKRGTQYTLKKGHVFFRFKYSHQFKNMIFDPRPSKGEAIQLVKNYWNHRFGPATWTYFWKDENETELDMNARA